VADRRWLLDLGLKAEAKWSTLVVQIKGSRLIFGCAQYYHLGTKAAGTAW
jgi:hypothetical protein